MTQLQQMTVSINQQTFALAYYPSVGMDDMFRELFINKCYLIPDFLRNEPGVILDVGANIGCFSVLFGALFPGKTLFAFEPAANTFELLKRNTTPLLNVRPFQCGLYDRDCTMPLYTGHVSSVTNSIAASPHNTPAFEVVALRRISTFLAEQGIERISILKIDTEGAETALMRDVQHLLHRIDAVFFEYHSEKDRIELDRMLCSRFMLIHGRVETAHRGVFCYVAKDLIAAHTNLNQLEIVLSLV